MCKICSERPVYVGLDGKNYCKNCFMEYVEDKIFKTISKYKLIERGDKVAVGLSGGKDSMTCLYILDKLSSKYKFDIFAILINEGIENYREITAKDAKKFCKKNKIKLIEFSFDKNFHLTLDKIKDKGISPCTNCGILRRYALNKAARENKATKLATGHNLDDEAQSLLMNEFKGNVSFSAKLGPRTGVLMHSKFIPRIKPLYFLTEKEILVYSKLRDLPITYIECPNSHDSFRNEIGKVLNELEVKYPGTKHSIISSFLNILPDLQNKYQHTKIGTCSICGEPAAKDICRACEILELNT
ncbi:TIGR00269 family protein [Candidatus Woesearchaeota archaeon]|nr:TIGR00269 family protein [Candidatus Woesearchaeota archaeon]